VYWPPVIPPHHPPLVVFLATHDPGDWTSAALDRLIRRLCPAADTVVLAASWGALAGVPVVGVPVAGVPAAVAVLEWAAAHAAELDADPERLLVAGAAAGGGLAAAVACAARDQGWPPIARQVLICPRVSDWPSRYGGLAPATIVTTGSALAAVDGRRYASGLRQVGVEVDELAYPDRVAAAERLPLDISTAVRAAGATVPPTQNS